MSFALAGNERVKSTVEGFLTKNRLPHAILITGDVGTGKKTLARYIARAAVCTGPEKPCGVCHGCRMADALSHPDIITVKRESGKKEMSVAVIRETRADAFIRPHEADRKVYIIEEADSMNQSAQNALLKVLEEPPESVIFILLSVSRAAFLPTVISRCTVLSLSSPSESEGESVLNGRFPEDKEAVKNALKATRGNIGQAIALLEKSDKNTVREAAKEFTELIFTGDRYKMLLLLSRFEKDRVAADRFFAELKIQLAEVIKTLPKNGKRASKVFALYGDVDEYTEHLKAYANLPLLFCKIVADINENRG